MKIPLIVYVKPSFDKCGPLVYLLTGSWVIESDHKDSTLVLALSPELEEELVHGMKVNGGNSVRVYIRNPGKESRITVYARRE